MSEIGDLLELLHGARRSHSSAHASIRLWRDEALEREARQRWVKAGQGARSVWRATLGSGEGSGDPTARGDWEQVARLWVSWPSQVRCEVELEWRGEPDHGTSVIDGDRWWQDTPALGFFIERG